MKTLAPFASSLALFLVLGAGTPALASSTLIDVAPDGAVEAAPLGEDIPVVVSHDLATLPGFYLSALHAGAVRDLDAAAGFFAAALAADPENPSLLQNSASLSVASGNIAKAVELAEPLLERNPSDQLGLLIMSVSDFRKGDLEAALERVRTLKDLGGPLQALVGGLMEGWILTADGRAAEAIRGLDDLGGPVWVEAFTRIHAGKIADHAGLLTIAEDRLRRAFEEDPTDIRIMETYARTLAQADKKDRAIAVLDNFQERFGTQNPIVDAVRAEIEAGTAGPLHGSPREGLAEALYGLGRGIGSNDATLAASLLQLALHVSPEAQFPALALGNILETMKQYEAAIDVYRTVPDDAPLHREARMQEALNLSALKRNEEAIAALSVLVEEDASDVQASISLGNVYRTIENFEEARAAYAAAIEQFDTVPDAYWTLYYYRGITNERTDRWPLAEKDFRQALEMEPDHPLVLNYLGYSYIDRGENLDEAIDMVRKAVDQRPKDGYIVDSLGWAYYRLGQYENAVRQLERAVNLRPADPVINDHLGDAYWKVGRKLEATFQWAHARDSDPEPELLTVIQKKLEKGLDAVLAEDEAEATAGVAPADDADDTQTQ